jgi:NAD(P)-dependent dehydrogenase (short-subunit alcohol dehydrogenase family)
MREFKDKVALITGGANGFGKAFAIEAAERGMKLALVDIDEADLTGTVAVLKNQGAEVLPIVADVTLYDNVKMTVDKTMKAFGQIDLLFCNAGVVPCGDILNLPARDWEWTAAANLTSHSHFYHEVVPIMVKQGTPAHIMGVSSIAGILHGIGNNATYSATKHGAVALIEDLRNYFRWNEIDNIGVSVYCPGYVQTDLHHCERHRPDRFKAQEDPYYQSEYYKGCLGRVNVSISTGIPIDSVGPRLFKAIEDKQMYILTHPQYLPYIESRHRAIEKDAELPEGGSGNSERNFKDQVALITGAAHGFGFEFAKEAASRGMKLALIDIVGEKLKEVKAYFDSKNVECMIYEGDTSIYEDVKASVDATMKTYGQIDVLFNNAGVAPVGNATAVHPRDFEWVAGVNMLGQAYYYHEVLPIMIKQGTPANVITTASIAGLLPGLGKNPAYSATKHAAVALSESVLAKLKELEANVKVSIYCPGFVQTNLHKSDDYRPDRFAKGEDPHFQTETYLKELERLENNIVTGTPIDPVGARLFKAMEEGQKYIITHTKHMDAVKARHAEIEADAKREL